MLKCLHAQSLLWIQYSTIQDHIVYTVRFYFKWIFTLTNLFCSHIIVTSYFLWSNSLIVLMTEAELQRGCKIHSNRASCLLCVQGPGVFDQTVKTEKKQNKTVRIYVKHHHRCFLLSAINSIKLIWQCWVPWTVPLGTKSSLIRLRWLGLMAQ